MNTTTVDLKKVIAESLADRYGAGSDLESVGDYDPETGYMEVHGNLDVGHLASEIIHQLGIQ